MIDRMLTTGQVAKVLGVSMRKVVELIDKGKLKGWTIPGSQHRRVEEKHLREFMREQGISDGRLEILDYWKISTRFCSLKGKDSD